jgi:MFS family permease
VYYGWVLVGTLGVTETVSFGVLSYAFPVFLTPMEAELGWSRTALTGAFSISSLIAGAAAIPTGRWIDRHGARGLMAGGSLAAALLLMAWSQVQHLALFYLLWALMGVAKAAVLYEPAFAVVTSWFERHRSRAITVLTFMGGFASVIFVPVATLLVEGRGWREALLWLALLLLLLTALPHALLLRRWPADHGLHPDGLPRPAADTRAGLAPVSARHALRSRSFRLLVLSFFLGALTTAGLTVHLIPLLLDRGFEPASAGLVMGMVGLMALPGRLVFTPLGARWPRAPVTAAIFVLQALGVVALVVGTGAASVWALVVLFGAGFGSITPARAALLAELYGVASYGRVSGVMALCLSLARAAAPVGVSLLHVAFGGYTGALVAMIGFSLAAAAAVLLAGSVRPGPSLELSPA